MKQKYTLSIADMEINVITDEPQESVEYIVGILDRKMREIALKSKKCTKSEAAILCALDLCADKIKLKQQVEELSDNLEERNEKFEHICEKLELVQKNGERLERERARLENENNRLRQMIDDLREGKSVSDFSLADNDTHSEAIDDAVAEAVPETDTRISPKKKSSNKSRVGTMFDLLTFTDI